MTTKKYYTYYGTPGCLLALRFDKAQSEGGLESKGTIVDLNSELVRSVDPRALQRSPASCQADVVKGQQSG